MSNPKGRDSDSSSANDNQGITKPFSAFSKMKVRGAERKEVALSLAEWVEKAKTDPSLYKTPAENLVSSIGEPTKIDTALEDMQTRRVYESKTIERYKPFDKFFDAETVVSRLVTYLKEGAEGLLVLNGPVGSGKTQIAETLEKLTEELPISVLKCKVTGAISPFLDSPLCLLADPSMRDYATDELGIHENYLKGMIKSPWVTKRLDFHGGDPEAAFEVVQVYPSRESQLGIGKYDPQNKDNPDFSALIGRVDMNKVGDPDPLYKNIAKDHPLAALRGKTLSEGDPDAYIPGLLSRSNGGILHLAEFLRNNPAMMNVFLEGVTTGYFTGAGNIGMLPMRQVIVITSNGPVLDEFRQAKESDAARNRIQEIKVGYTLRMSEELKIYKKFVKEDNLSKFPVAPKTLDLLAEFSVAARLKDGVGGALKSYDIFTRTKVLNGEKPDGVKVPDIKELRSKASPDEGMSGFSVRDAKRALKLAFSVLGHGNGVSEADTITMLEAIRARLKEVDVNDISNAEKDRLRGLIGTIEEANKKELEKIVNAAIMSADDSTCQRMFDEYVHYAKAWVEGSSVQNESGILMDMNRITRYLDAFEKRAGINNGADFRKTTVAYVNAEESRIGKNNYGKAIDEQKPVLVRWDSYEPVAKSIRKHFEVDREAKIHILRAKEQEDLRSDEEKRQFSVFHENMKAQGYTNTMVTRMLDHLSYT